MKDMQFGDVLREARERSGEDLMTVARRIRIRPDILERIEASDLEGMPPRGYSRNMVNAYARYLGLNTTEVVKMYLDAQYNDQVERARANIRPTGFDMSGGRRSHREEAEGRRHHEGRRGRDASSGMSSATSARYSRNRSRNDGFDNDYFDDIMPDSARRAVADRPRSSASSTRRLGAVHVGAYNAYGQGLAEREQSRSAGATRRLDPVDEPRTSRNTHRARRSSMPTEHYTNLYAAPSNLGVNKGGLRDKAPFIIAGIIILLLVVIIAFMASGLGRASSAEVQEPEPMDITGMPESNTTTQETAEGTAEKTKQAAAEPEPAPVAPEKAVVKYQVADGQSVYVEIYVDGDCVKAETITGPYDEAFDVTGTLEFVASPPDGVTLTQDGKEIALEAGESGVASVTIDFAEILAAWKAENNVSDSADASDASAASAEGAADTTSASA